ncbi:MAG: flagellar FlbD family protein [Acidobacteriia bacterium]|nr:flagellar FlbD family protein [Terriglobia bacterium]
MVRLTRLNHAPIVLNSDLIERIEITPDTVITLTNGQIFRVRETAEQVIQLVVDFRRRILDPGQVLGVSTEPADGPDPKDRS